MTTRKRPAHFCTQEETIKRINYLLVGNGNPKEGILFKFEQFMNEHGDLIEDIKEIKEGVRGLHSRADENKQAAATVASALEKYKLETDVFEKGKKSVIEGDRLKRNLMYSRVITIGTIVISLFMAWLGYKDLMSQGKATEAEAKTTNELLAPDSTQSTVSIRGNVYIPILKTDSANIIHGNKLDSIYDKFKAGQK